MTGPVLVLVEQTETVLTNPTRELLTVARRVSPDLAPVAVWLGAAADLDVAGLGAYGVERAYLPDLGGVDPHAPVAAAEALAAVVAASEPEAVLVASTYVTKEVVAVLAVLLGAGVIVDGTGLTRAADGGLVVEKAVFASTWTTRCTVVGDGPALLALKSHAVEPEAVAAGTTPAVVPVPVTYTPAATAVRVVQRTERHADDGRPSLTDARVVVVGGRGVEGDFAAVEDLADALGGAVGATRVATDEGWIDHAAQIGQTGVSIAPRLYVGAGVSGAVHHRSGMQASEVIVAVNTDQDAPIFEIADFGVVGDLAEVLPQAASEIRRLQGE